ncbi:acyltransferase [Thioalkalivibrio sp.]|uniref:acyltransferase n=1 Tax=Thioalkalivibrio sp. TaxID=2093813 RepID=UPI00356B02CC
MKGTDDDFVAAARAANQSGGGAIGAYMDLVVGARSWPQLLKHEFIGAWLSGTPGALGLALRRLLWRSLFRSVGGRVVWGRHITLRHPGKMDIGAAVVVDDHCQLDAQGCDHGEFSIGTDALISRGCIVSGKDGALAIGPRVNIGAGCILYASTELRIGADSMLAAMCYVGGGRYTARGRTDIPIAAQPIPRMGVVIEEDCWLGAGVIVIDGVHIGRGSVIAAGAVVTTDVAPYSVVAGVPGRPIANRLEEPSSGSDSV